MAQAQESKTELPQKGTMALNSQKEAFATAKDSSGIDKIEDQVVDLAKQAYEAIVDNASMMVRKVGTKSGKVMREHPLGCTLGAAAVGILAGAYFLRSRKG